MSFTIHNVPAFAHWIAHALGLSFGPDGSAGHIVREGTYYVQVMCFETLRWGCSSVGNGVMG